LAEHPGAVIYMATTKAERTYCDVRYEDGCYIMFGKESAAIPEEILKENRERCVRIPMLEGKRSLNLSNAASIILYEALRQNRFEGLLSEGRLHRLSWDS
jgi:tRNA (cytidine/uridine-2'-O-)-methyltransferase